MKKKTKKKICKTCYGYGLWNDDSNQPMGPIDASDGFSTKPCPECGASSRIDFKTRRKEEFLKQKEIEKAEIMARISKMSREEIAKEILALVKEIEERINEDT